MGPFYVLFKVMISGMHNVRLETEFHTLFLAFDANSGGGQSNGNFGFAMDKAVEFGKSVDWLSTEIRSIEKLEGVMEVIPIDKEKYGL